MLFIVFIAARDIHKVILIPLAIISLGITMKLNMFYSNVIIQMNETAVACEKAAEVIEPNSVVLPLNCSDNWLALHFSNYLGVQKPMLILENYEATNDYFPLLWNQNALFDYRLGKYRSAELEGFRWQTNESRQIAQPDYVFLLGKLNSNINHTHGLVETELKDSFKLTFNLGECSVYQYRGYESQP